MGEGMAHVGEPNKCKALSLNPSTTKKQGEKERGEEWRRGERRRHEETGGDVRGEKRKGSKGRGGGRKVERGNPNLPLHSGNFSVHTGYPPPLEVKLKVHKVTVSSFMVLHINYSVMNYTLHCLIWTNGNLISLAD
jgi:hypothetical protein